MARKTSDFLKGWGKASEVFKAIVDAVLSLGGDDSDVGNVLTDKNLRIQIAQLIVGAKRAVLQFLDCTVSITMDLSKTMTQLIADGTYDWVNANIAKHFAIATGEGARTTDVHLLHYNKKMTSDQVLADMDRQGLRPATFLELLWIRIQHPKLQRRFPIIALGTAVQVGSHRIVVGLNVFVRGGGLSPYWYGCEWGWFSRFAAVRK